MSHSLRSHYLSVVPEQLKEIQDPSRRADLLATLEWLRSDDWLLLEVSLNTQGIFGPVPRLLLYGILASNWPAEPLAEILLALRRADWPAEQIADLLARHPVWRKASRRQHWADHLAERIREADAEILRERRPGANFELLEVRRSGSDSRVVWEMTLLPDGEQTTRSIALTTPQLCSEIRFRQKCLEVLHFIAILRLHYSGEHYARFLNFIAGAAGAAPRDSANDLLAAVARDLAAESGGRWIGTPTELWQEVTRRADMMGPLPLRWPRSPDALAWAMRRATPELRAIGVEWCRGRQHSPEGGRRTVALRLRQVREEAPRTG